MFSTQFNLIILKIGHTFSTFTCTVFQLYRYINTYIASKHIVSILIYLYKAHLTNNTSSNFPCLLFIFILLTKGVRPLEKPSSWPLRSMKFCSQPVKMRPNRPRQMLLPADVKPTSFWAPTTRGPKLWCCTSMD